MVTIHSNAQSIFSVKENFTRQDTLRGSITPERAWWDLTYYDLDISVNPETKSISGKNTIQYKALKENNIIQIDLQPPMKITSVTQNGKSLEVEHDINAHFITLLDKQNIGEIHELEVFFEGNPREAIKPPWDGGISWDKDLNGNHFIASSCQGLGASVWWPCKDHMYDEVDSMAISVNVPKGLMDISNGRLQGIEEKNDGTNTFHWFVNNPINNYGVNLSIGDYATFSEIYEGEKGNLDMIYYVLNYNLEIAKIHFKEAPKMMEAFEHWFGPYPFYEDSFKLVEVPYLGMEHQSCVTYGNGYRNGYMGKDYWSGTGWGLKFDYIIVHEAGHEWFANNITAKDIADLWIQESFTTYSESLFIEYYYGKQAASEYLIGTRKHLANKTPIIGGNYNVNKKGNSIDLYYKGANFLHTLRQLIEDDEKWRQILRGLNKRFYHQTVTTRQIEDYISEQSGIDLTEFFNQYLRAAKIPTLEYQIENGNLKYRWTNIVDKFDMPVLVTINNKEVWLFPKADWKTFKLNSENSTFKINPNFYIEAKQI